MDESARVAAAARADDDLRLHVSTAAVDCFVSIFDEIELRRYDT